MISVRALSNSAAHDPLLKSVTQKSVSVVLLVLISGEKCKKKKEKEIYLLKVPLVGLTDMRSNKDSP